MEAALKTLEQPVKEKEKAEKAEVKKGTTTDQGGIKKKAEGDRVVLEFPYDDLATFYEYALKELGITDPFK